MTIKLNKKQKELLTQVEIGSHTTVGYVMVPHDDDLKLLIDNGDVVINPEIAEGDKVAARMKNLGGMPSAELPNGEAPASLVYQLMKGIPMAPAKRGAQKEERYPFSVMEVDESFLVPCTDKFPKPWESFATTVSSATRRFSVKSETGETRKNRKGEEIPVLVPTKKFTLRRVTAGDKYPNGYVEAASGARVFRIQ